MLNFADAAASIIHPFIGLRPFRIEDAAFFFGREQQIATLLQLVHNGSLVSVVGSSGSGKSSLVRAGLLPALTSAETGEPEWDWIEMRPGESPVRNLAEALARPNEGAGAANLDSLAESRADRIEITLRSSSFGIGEALGGANARERTRLLIVVDQFEEIFRYANLRARHNTNPARASELRDEATFFVQLLLTAATDEHFSGAIVLTMRSDFIGDCARFQGLSEAVTRTQYLVPALTRDQRALAIRGPVQRAGATIEPALVQQVLNDTSEDPDQLPVLQHAMMRCCQRAQDHDRPSPPAFTLARYNEIGGIEKALTQHGDELLEGLAQPDEATGDLDLQHIAKRIFQSLTEIESQGRVIRRPQTIGDLVKAIVRDDAPSEEVARVEAAVRKVVAHFADPMCSFLRAPTEDTLSANAVVDIGHEALIRRWERLGGDDPASWVRQERADAEAYGRLVSFAELDTFLPRPLLEEFEAWWQQRQPTRFWASRYTRGGEDRLDAAADLLTRSRAEVARKREEALQKRLRRRKQMVGGAVAALAVVALVAGFEVWQARANQEQVAKAQAEQIAAAGLNLLSRDSADQAALLAVYALSPGKSGGARDWWSFENLAKLLPFTDSRDQSPSSLPIEPENMALGYAALQNMDERAVFAVQKGMVGVVFGPVGKSKELELMTTSWSDNSSWVWDTKSVWKENEHVGIAGPRKLDSQVKLSPFLLSINETGDVMLSGPSMGSDGIRLYSTADSENWTSNGDKLWFDHQWPRFGVLAADQDLMLTGGAGTKWTMWDVSRPDHDTGKVTVTPTHTFVDIEPATGYLAAAAISPSGIYAAIARSSDGFVQVYDGLDYGANWSPAGEPLKPADPDKNVCGERYQAQHAAPPKKIVKWLTFDPTNPDTLIGAYDQADNIQVWSVGTGKVTTLETCSNLPIFRVAVSPDGRFVAASIQDPPRIYLWDMTSLDSGPGSREYPRLLRGSPGDGGITSIAFDNDHHIAAGTSNGKVSLWYTEPALSRDPPSSESAALKETACTATWRAESGHGWTVSFKSNGATDAGHRIVGRRVEAQATGSNNAAGPSSNIVACKFLSDGNWILLAPSHGRIMLFDWNYPDSPVAAFGDSRTEWKDAHFTDDDQIVAQPASGLSRTWKYFDNKDDLVKFIGKSLPFISTTVGGHLTQLGLPEATLDLLHGKFWQLMNESENEGSQALKYVPPGDAGGNTTTVSGAAQAGSETRPSH